MMSYVKTWISLPGVFSPQDFPTLESLTDAAKAAIVAQVSAFQQERGEDDLIEVQELQVSERGGGLQAAEAVAGCVFSPPQPWLRSRFRPRHAQRVNDGGMALTPPPHHSVTHTHVPV